MRSNAEYLNDYHQKKFSLEAKGELWRLRVTEDEFIAGLEKIRSYGEEARKGNYLTEYHIERNEEGQVSVMLMDILTIEEMIEQFNRLKNNSQEQFAKEAPEIQRRIKNLTTPLKFHDAVKIYRYLIRKQISLEMLPENVLEEFKKTRHFRLLMSRNLL